jgi:hypothetical protein
MGSVRNRTSIRGSLDFAVSRCREPQMPVGFFLYVHCKSLNPMIYFRLTRIENHGPLDRLS